MVIERWLPVPGYDGLYEVSDQGRVRSLDREIPNRPGLVGHIHGRVLRSRRGGRMRRWNQVRLSREGRGRPVFVYRLVAEAFIGPLPPGLETLHGRGGTLDDRLVNLRYGTRAENNADQELQGVRARGSGHPNAKLTEGVVLICRRRAEAGEFSATLAQEYGVSKATMAKAVAGRTWRHVQCSST